MVDLRHCHYDEEVSRLLANAEFDFDAAAQLLLIFAKHLRDGTPIPGSLVEHVAGAIEYSMNKESKDSKLTKLERAKKTKEARATALLRELKLAAPNRRKKGDPYLIGVMFEEERKSNPAKSDPQVAKLVADKYKRAHKLKTMTSDTVLRRLSEYLDACKTPD